VSLTVPSRNGDRNPDDPPNFPLYELAESLDVRSGSTPVDAVSATTCSLTPTPSCTPSNSHSTGCSQPPPWFAAACRTVSIMRIALLESGTGWVPFLFERLDEHFEYRPQEMPNINPAPFGVPE